jgi:hypothetical protein
MKEKFDCAGFEDGEKDQTRAGKDKERTSSS